MILSVTVLTKSRGMAVDRRFENLYTTMSGHYRQGRGCRRDLVDWSESSSSADVLNNGPLPG